VLSEFLNEPSPTPQCHASTIVETADGLVAAWFGGTHEKNPDVGIWITRNQGGRWTAPVEVANGVRPDGTRQPCWNPVLFQPKDGPLMLFYKVGPSPTFWWGMVMCSGDNGRSWSAPEQLATGILGPIKNKPVQLANGDIVSPTSSELGGWYAYFERSSDGGRTWSRTPPVNDGVEISAIQPSILLHRDGRLQAVGRTMQKRIFSTETTDGGKSWSPMRLLSLPNPNSGIDAVTLTDGRHLVVYNHTTKGRGRLNVAVSSDGRDWQAALVLEHEPEMEFSYPAVIQTRDEKVHVTYTWKRKLIRHVVIDPAKFTLRPINDADTPVKSSDDLQPLEAVTVPGVVQRE
jgi:predicted neuraminidase